MKIHPMFAAAIVLVAGTLAAPALAQESATVQDASDISLDVAQQAIQAAADKAQELEVSMCIAVVDAGANLKAFHRMDGAWLGSIDIAISKAKTSRMFDMDSGEIGKLSQPGGPLYGIEVSNGGLVSFPGGVVIRNGEGVAVGAIGVSGSTVENDHECAMAGASAVSGGADAGIQEVLSQFKAALESKNIEQLRPMISEDFSHYEWGNKNNLIAFIQLSMSQGDLDNAEVDLDYAEVEVTGDKAIVYPVELVAAFGSATIEMTLQKEEDGGWRMTGMELEGI